MGIAAYNRGSRAISAYIDQQLAEARGVPVPRWRPPQGWFKAACDERDTEAVYWSLVDNNERRIARGLPPFTPSYELAQKIVQNWGGAAVMTLPANKNSATGRPGSEAA